MKKEFLKVASHRHFFDKHDKVLIAVSGGLDSMTLLNLLESCQDILSIKIAIAHIHHGQRAESDIEASYLANYAKEKNIPFHMTYFQGNFSEKNARDFRYQFFREVMEINGYTALVTAHHADDQAETVFMRFLRGGRLSHLSAIKERQNFGPGELIRPLLTFQKSDFPPIFHFEDSSNELRDYFRNRVRKDYFPQLRQENPQLTSHLQRLAEEVSQMTQAIKYLTQHIDCQDLETFRKYPKEVQNFLLEYYLSTFDSLQISKAQFETILHLLNTKKNKIYPLKSHHILRIGYDRFEIEKINLETDESKKSYVLQSGNLCLFGNFQFSFDNPLDDCDQMIALKNSSPLILRHQKTGDKIFYRGHHRKLKRIYQEKQIDIAQRESAVIIEQKGIVVAIAGIAVSDLSKSLKNDTIRGVLYIKKMK